VENQDVEPDSSSTNAQATIPKAKCETAPTPAQTLQQSVEAMKIQPLRRSQI
jgi:hypothetical protein